MPYIHARHLARLRLEQRLEDYRQALRQWQHQLAVRQQLLAKLASLQRKLARQAKRPRIQHLPVLTYEINGAWFRQIGRRRATAISLSS